MAWVCEVQTKDPRSGSRSVQRFDLLVVCSSTDQKDESDTKANTGNALHEEHRRSSIASLTMVLSGAFRRSRAVLARYNVEPHMVKYWSKQKPDNGVVTRHLSPYEQQPVAPWLKTFPKKVVDRAPYYVTYLGGSMVLTYLTVVWAEKVDDDESRAHRF